ncbi:Fe-S protein [Legionella busanensis]|uniref:Fe-S protein n=1 Tax=Legionella busanensis TaxID=190655 RepID=A0A378JPG8_9GAMM|nr:hypothetical protein [Legionella busanensis]STX51860.1 Fe-S protein [Legionella busanensis]
MYRFAARFLPFLFSLMCSSAVAGPWYTGPLLAPAGHTIPRGHTNLEPYAFYTDNDGIYTRHWRLSHVPHSESIIGNPVITHGMTDKLDIQYTLPYTYNEQQGRSYQHIADVSAILGYQALEQGKTKWWPDLRVTVQEIFPSGKFKDLNPLNNGVDATGLGSYQTGFNLNFQHLLQLTEVNYLRTRFSAGYLIPLDVNIRGVTAYGGTANTNGRINPGNMLTFDLAWELNLTQNWVAVMEGYYASRDKTRFRGFRGLTDKNKVPTIGHQYLEEISLAPAIEYNFNANVGIIGGYWFSVAGKDATDFKSVVVALNIYI